MDKRRIAGAIGLIAIVVGACTGGSTGSAAPPKPSVPAAVGSRPTSSATVRAYVNTIEYFTRRNTLGQ